MIDQVARAPTVPDSWLAQTLVDAGVLSAAQLAGIVPEGTLWGTVVTGYRGRLGVVEIMPVADGLDALELVAQHQLDLMVLDMDMPRLDGLGVLEELRASVATAQIPVIVLTARSDDTESRALDLGAQDYLTKPVRPTALSARVRAVLRRVRV